MVLCRFPNCDLSWSFRSTTASTVHVWLERPVPSSGFVNARCHGPTKHSRAVARLTRWRGLKRPPTGIPRLFLLILTDHVHPLGVAKLQQAPPLQWASLLKFVWQEQPRWVQIGGHCASHAELVAISVPQGCVCAPLALAVLLIDV